MMPRVAGGFFGIKSSLLICYRKKHIPEDVLYSCLASQSSVNCDNKLRKHFFLDGGIIDVHTWVTAPTSFPSWRMGEPDRGDCYYGQQLQEKSFGRHLKRGLIKGII